MLPETVHTEGPQVMQINEAKWEPTHEPKAGLALWYTELAGGIMKQGKFTHHWQVLLASNGKIYKRSEITTRGGPVTTSWEGYTV